MVSKLNDIGISRWIVSSTSSIENNYDAVKRELKKIIELEPCKSFPALWVTPEMLIKSPDLNYFFDDINYYAIKIHGLANKWYSNGRNLNRVFEIAKERNLPIILHTGGHKKTNASVYTSICSKHSTVKVILAHGRPLDEAISIINSNINVSVDISFMSIENVETLIHSVNPDKIIFGTDFPMDLIYYQNESIRDRYKKRLDLLISTIGFENFYKISNINIEQLFFTK